LSRYVSGLVLMITILLGTATLGLTLPDEQTGLFFGVALDGYPLDRQRLNTVSGEVGLDLSMVVFFLQWPQQPRNGHFPWKTLQVIHEFGAMPCLTWEPMYILDGQEHVILAEQILDGAYDPYMRDFARSARDFGEPIALRFAHEMNLSRYHWGVRAEEYGPSSPDVYKKMFRHVVDIFRREKADNVLFVFCPNAESLPHPLWSEHGAWNTAAAYYPGHAFVDILGVDGYNWGTTQNSEMHGWDSTFRSFADIMGPMVAQLRDLAPDKPLVVFETASTNQGGDKNAWISQALTTMRDWNVQGFVWFEADKEVDWRLNTGLEPATLSTMQGAITSQADRALSGLRDKQP
jgi:mannan endo-1,4-beta-mannosidase